VNLYPFGDTDQEDYASRSAIGHIDIGGPMLIRAAALNYRHVAVLTSPDQYEEVLGLLRANRNELPELVLADLASRAFAVVASYEAQVSEWFSRHHSELARQSSSRRSRVDWVQCELCAGAVASSRVHHCYRHLSASARQSELALSEGIIDLRNVHLPGTLLSDILRPFSGQDGRPHIRSLRCEWAKFEGAVSLGAAIVEEDIDLSGARFYSTLDCRDLIVNGDFLCRDARLRAALFDSARFAGMATFRGSDLLEASIESAQFIGLAKFNDTHFADRVSFRSAAFNADVHFFDATFRRQADFTNALWLGDCRFRGARFEELPLVDGMRVSEASLPADSQPSGESSHHEPQSPLGDELPIVLIGSSLERLRVGRAVQQNLDHNAQPVLWNQGVVRPSEIVLDALRTRLNESDFAVFVLGSDDLVVSREAEMFAPRDNIILECGLAVGLLGLNRTFLLAPRHLEVKVPTDLAGIALETYDERRPSPRSSTGSACTSFIEQIEDLGSRPR
jgi:uncharacterized protein YjbI with pentapeptide repeats